MTRTRLRWLGITSLVIASVALAGCSAAFSVGAAKRATQLSQLAVGTSTDAEVVRALGEPRGRGVARLAGVEGARTIWFYDAYSGDSSRVDMNFLIVFLEGSRYDGYLWMSSSQLLEKAP